MRKWPISFMILLICSVYTELYAQKELAKPLEQEFAFNSTPLITSFLPFDSNPVLNTNDFSVIMKKKTVGPGWYRRTAMRLLLGNHEGFDLNSILIKRGVEKKIPLTKTWIFHYGIEAFLGLSELPGTDTRAELGVAGIYGVQCMLNDRIALGTEGYVESSLVIDGFNLKIRQPRTLLFSIYF